jgi:hypothetical protein
VVAGIDVGGIEVGGIDVGWAGTAVGIAVAAGPQAVKIIVAMASRPMILIKRVFIFLILQSYRKSGLIGSFFMKCYTFY